MKYLLAWKADMDVQDVEYKYSSLHLAAVQGYTRIARRLLVKGINRELKVMESGDKGLGLQRKNGLVDRAVQQVLLDEPDDCKSD